MEPSPFVQKTGVDKKAPRGVESIVSKKIKELPTEITPDLIKIVAWIHTLQDVTSKQACMDIIRAKFVEPYAMSHDEQKYQRALEISDMLSSAEHALSIVRDLALQEFSRQTGSEGATTARETERLINGLEAIVKAKKAEEGHRTKTELVSGEYEKRKHVVDGEDDLGGPVDRSAQEVYKKFTTRKDKRAA